jgi:integrase
VQKCDRFHANRYGLAPIAASTHPFTSWSTQRHTDKDRYNEIAHDLQALRRRMVIGGMRSDRAEAYKTWSDAECANFEASNPPPAMMTAYMLGRYTGQRGVDILKWTRTAYNGREFRFRQSKTERLGRPEMVIPALPPLKAYLDALVQTNTVMLVAMPDGTEYKASHFRHQFRAALDACGLKHLSFHGLRHAAGVALAEAGATEKEIMAWFGHSTPAMAAHYCKMAEQKKLTRSAGSKWTASKQVKE